MGVVSETAKIRTGITSSIFVRMGQVRSPSIIEWLFVRFEDQIKKLWRFVVAMGLHLQWLWKNVYLAPTLRRETRGYLTVR
jgi:hypothetical protein